MLISTCQSLSSKLSSRQRSQQITVLRTLPILTDFWCHCSCAPVQWSHLGPFPLWYGGVRFLWFLCFRGLSDCQICSDCAFYLTVTEQYAQDVFWCLCCLCLCSLSVSPKCLCRFLPASESEFWFLVFVSSSSLFFLFQCFVGDVYLLDSCALSAACALYVIWVQFYFKPGECALHAAVAYRPKITVTFPARKGLHEACWHWELTLIQTWFCAWICSDKSMVPFSWIEPLEDN